jgi:hypothetical protein
MSLFGRLKEWLGVGEPDEPDRGDADETTPRPQRSEATRTARPDAGSTGSSDPDAGIPDAESGTGPGADDGRTGPALKCSVCGTDVDAGAAACPLCRSTDLRPASQSNGASAPGRPPGRTTDASDVSALVEEAETRSDATEATPHVPSVSDASTTETGAEDRPDEAGGTRGETAEEAMDGPPDDVQFAGPGPAETRARTAETDEEAVSRLQELRRKHAADDSDRPQ